LFASRFNIGGMSSPSLAGFSQGIVIATSELFSSDAAIFATH
jgi:hypothetical protein